MPILEIIIESPDAQTLAYELSEVIRKELSIEPQQIFRSLRNEDTHKDVATAIAVISLLIALPGAISDAPQALKNLKAVIEWGKEKVFTSRNTLITLGVNNSPPLPIEEVDDRDYLGEN
jgi:hypothetical protein